MTVDEFLVWDSGDGSGRLWQLVDGEPVAMAPASRDHGALQAESSRLIGNHLRALRPGCQLIVAPGVVPNVNAPTNLRIPDLGVTCSPPAAEPLVSNTVLLVEILLPSNEAKTRQNIWAYTTIPTVLELLTLHSTRIEAELLRRLPDGNWPKQPAIFRTGDSLTLTSIGLVMAVEDFYRTTSIKP